MSYILGPKQKLREGGFLLQIFEYFENPTVLYWLTEMERFRHFYRLFCFSKCLMEHFMVPGCCSYRHEWGELIVHNWAGGSPAKGEGAISLETASFYMKYLVPVLNHTRSYFILKKSSKAELNNLVQPKIIKLLSYRQARNISKYLSTIRQSKIWITI